MASHLQSCGDFLTGCFSLVERKIAIPGAGQVPYPLSRLAVYAIRIQQLWKRNSPTFLIRACLATRSSDA